MKENKTGKRRRLAVFFLKTRRGITLLFIPLCAILPALLFHFWYITSDVWIGNQSAMGVRFKRVMIEDKVVWDKPDVIIASREAIRHKFRAPKKSVELKVVVVNETHEEEILSCNLDNRGRPCWFVVYYTKGTLVCQDCISD